MTTTISDPFGISLIASPHWIFSPGFRVDHLQMVKALAFHRFDYLGVNRKYL